MKIGDHTANTAKKESEVTLDGNEANSSQAIKGYVRPQLKKYGALSSVLQSVGGADIDFFGSHSI